MKTPCAMQTSPEALPGSQTQAMPRGVSGACARFAAKVAERCHLGAPAQAAVVNVRGVRLALLYRGAELSLWHTTTPHKVTCTQARQWVRAITQAWGGWPIITAMAEANELIVTAPKVGTRQVLWGRSLAPEAFLEQVLARLEPGSVGLEALLAVEEGMEQQPLDLRFVRDFKAAWRELSAAWCRQHGLPVEEADALAQLVLNRLLFLAFVASRGWLDGRPAFLLEECAKRIATGESLSQSLLTPLFFGALNRSAKGRTAEARALGAIPFLNGGLFQATALDRAHLAHALSDPVLWRVIQRLFGRYRFMTHELTQAPHPAYLGPAMLGRVFESMMHPEERSQSGTFYTPQAVVQRLVVAALVRYSANVLERKGLVVPPRLEALFLGRGQGLSRSVAAALEGALAQVRVLDPAVGSGAFIMGTLEALQAARLALARRLGTKPCVHEIRHHIVTQNLFGVDINPLALRICELRLWLALLVTSPAQRAEEVPPLPNLDYAMRCGDALLEAGDWDPLLLWQESEGLGRPERARALARLKRRYGRATGRHKRRLAERIAVKERSLQALAFERAQAALRARLDALRRVAVTPDLFGCPRALSAGELAHKKDLTLRLAALEEQVAQMNHGRAPGFSFALHFAEHMAQGGFDVIVGNPPWVRPHRLSEAYKRALKRRYQVLHGSAWQRGGRKGGVAQAGQVDLAALFVERSLALLRPGGVASMLLPVKLFTALGGGAFRRLVGREAEIAGIIDWSRADLFQAATYPAGLVLVKRAAPRQGQPLWIATVTGEGDAASGAGSGGATPPLRLVDQARLRLVPDDLSSPWRLGSQAQACLLNEHGVQVGQQFTLRRGIFSAARKLFVPRALTPAGDPAAAVLRADFGEWGEVALEREVLVPVLRGADLSPYGAAATQRMIFGYHSELEAWPRREALPALAQTWLARHAAQLQRRKGLRPDEPLWTLFRVHPDMGKAKVVWRDIGRRVAASYVPAHADLVLPLNTVYYTAVPDDETGYLLAALLNSRSAQAFADAIAEPARGGYHRYFSWVISLLPWPFGAVAPVERRRLAALSARAHECAGADEALNEAIERRVDAALARHAERSLSAIGV